MTSNPICLKFHMISLFSIIFLVSSCTPCQEKEVCFVPEGELQTRIGRNLERLESKKYLPENVFLTEEQSGGWPGDTEGRTILGLVCDTRVGNLHSSTLQDIIGLIPSHLNRRGYMGPDYGQVMDEQQFSGNGWMLRGLCAYYDQTGDGQVLDIIRSISDSLFVRHSGKYITYPIMDSERQICGEASGHISDISGDWRLSSDIGCLFIGMDGLIDAWRLIGGEDVRNVIEEMIGRFLETDIIGIKAQTHASLTACRGLIRFAELTGRNEYIEEVIKRWELYKQYGMTENYGNYNWFRRYDTWTEPCAITDSFILALKLWEHTGNTGYLEDAHLIWYNAICHTQRSNGGFGCDICPGAGSGPEIAIHIEEAHWCCTMRGAEALATATESLAQIKDDGLYITAFHDGTIRWGDTQISMHSDYPYPGKIAFAVTEGRVPAGKLKIFKPSWMNVSETCINGKVVAEDYLINDFINIDKDLHKGDSLIISYKSETRRMPMLNAENALDGRERIFQGPLMLDGNGNPIYHIMDPEVSKWKDYHRLVLHEH